LYQLHPKETADVICGRLEENWEDEQVREGGKEGARGVRRG
jgi:hypothetical protein